MSKKEKRKRLRINDDTMTTIVTFALFFCAVITVVGMYIGYCGHDVSAIVDSTHRVFGTELAICGLMTMYKRWCDWTDEKAEKRKKRRAKSEEDVVV